MANPGGKNQYGGPYNGGALKKAAQGALKAIKKSASGGGGHHSRTGHSGRDGGSATVHRMDSMPSAPSRSKTSALQKPKAPSPSKAPAARKAAPRPAAKASAPRASKPSGPAKSGRSAAPAVSPNDIPHLTDAQLQEMAKTPKGRAAIRKHMRDRENAWSQHARRPADASGFTGPAKPRTKTSSLRKPKAGARKTK